MSVYPMLVTKWSGRANNRHGGKDYHLALVTTADDRALLIQRWGRARMWGSGWKVTTGTLKKVRADYFAKRNEKGGGEYSEELIDTVRSCANESAIKKELGAQYWRQLDPDDLTFLDPDMDTAGATGRSRGLVVRDEDGNLVVKPNRNEHAALGHQPAPDPKKLEEEKRAEIEREIAVNPMWGMF